MRRDDAGDRDRRADRIIDRTPLQPHRLARDEIGRDRGKGNRQILDGCIAEHVADRVQDLAGTQHAGG